MVNALEMKNIYREYGGKHTEVVVLRGSSFTIQPGEFVTVIGSSGPGKSTFLAAVAGLQTPTSGEVIIDEQSLNKLARKQCLAQRFQRIGFTLQSSNLMPFLTMGDQFHLTGKVGKSCKNSELREQLLEALGLKELRSNYSRGLSGGERRRVAVAYVLYHEPDVILTDEPTTSLDTEGALDVIKLLVKEAKERDKEIVMVTHDERLLEYCDRVVRIRDGELIE